VAYVIENEIPNLDRQTQNRLELLASRYQQNGNVQIARLIDDLAPRRMYDQKRLSPQTRKEDKINYADKVKVEALMEKITYKCDKEEISDLARKLAK